MSEKVSYPIFSIPFPSQTSSDQTTLFQALATALTSSYALVGTEIGCQGHTRGFLHLYWTKGDETSVEVKAEYALVPGGTQAQETVETATSSAGQSTVKIADYSFSTATDNIIIPIRVQGRFLNIYIKATGGTPTGTYGMGLFLFRE